MPGLSKRKSEARRRAVLKFFLANPEATGDEALAALASGQLTGENGPPMGFGMLYRLKREADAQRSRPVSHGASSGREGLAELRELATRMRSVLELVPEVSEVRVTRAGTRVLRSITTEEAL